MFRWLHLIVVGLALLATTVLPASAGEFEDGLAAFKRKEFAVAANLWRQAADQGNAVAQYNLGLMNARGLGMPRNHTQAAAWYRLAAKQGYLDAQNNLGVLYRNGRGLPVDYAQAAKWWQLAAKKGHARSQYNLGDLYKDGLGVPQNTGVAVKWYRLAAKRGHAGARKRLAAITRNAQPGAGSNAKSDMTRQSDAELPTHAAQPAAPAQNQAALQGQRDGELLSTLPIELPPQQNSQPVTSTPALALPNVKIRRSATRTKPPLPRRRPRAIAVRRAEPEIPQYAEEPVFDWTQRASEPLPETAARAPGAGQVYYNQLPPTGRGVPGAQPKKKLSWPYREVVRSAPAETGPRNYNAPASQRPAGPAPKKQNLFSWGAPKPAPSVPANTKGRNYNVPESQRPKTRVPKVTNWFWGSSSSGRRTNTDAEDDEVSN